MSQIVYATRRVPNLEGRTFRNPHHFNGAEEGATKVFIEGDWPAIREAYEAKNIPVASVSEMHALPGKATEPRKPRTARKTSPAKTDKPVPVAAPVPTAASDGSVQTSS